MGKWTQGPWRWEFNPKTKTAQLCGGKPQFDSTVMDFIRVGMFGAGPRVIDQTDLGLLTGVAKFAQPSAGREHHSSWFQVLRHPDLDLIAAAPELAEALVIVHECGLPEKVSMYDEEGVEGWQWCHPDGRIWSEIGSWYEAPPMHPIARAALAKAGASPINIDTAIDNARGGK